MSVADIVKERPVAPPSTGSAEMKKDVEEVKWYSENITRERIAVVHKWADGAGTYTPPGHWNDIAAEYVSDARFSEVRAARAFALLNMAMHDAAVGCWETKYFYFNPRPSQMDPRIKTSTGVPNFPAFTSGHSTFSGAAASVLTYLFPDQWRLLQRPGHRSFALAFVWRHTLPHRYRGGPCSRLCYWRLHGALCANGWCRIVFLQRTHQI